LSTPERRVDLKMDVDSINLMQIRYEGGDFDDCRKFYADMTRHFRQARDPDWPGLASREESWARARAIMCRAAMGDTAGFELRADTLQALGGVSGYGRDQRLHHYVRGLLWQARGDHQKAVTELTQALSSPNMGFTRINYELARSFLTLNQPARAVAIMQPVFRGSLDASGLYLTRTEAHEMLARAWDAAGNRDSARVHWIAVESAWRQADPIFRSRWEAARSHLLN
jgi:hypothetical protein